ncbi:MAG: class I SAM-dependent methyltransferase [Candidatus Hydrothermia bacterium]|jgi:SAM-dependent methyltransferase
MKITRGEGILENFLANERYKVVKKVLMNFKNKNRVLDIGCGSYPKFLISLDFKEKFGIDKYDYNFSSYGIKFIKLDLEKENKLPFEDNFFDVITALALIEHLKLDAVRNLFIEAFRILKNEGIFIITTPSRISKPILELFSKIKIVSKEEIDEHKHYYEVYEIYDLFNYANFKNVNVEKFEFGLNIIGYGYKLQ